VTGKPVRGYRRSRSGNLSADRIDFLIQLVFRPLRRSAPHELPRQIQRAHGLFFQNGFAVDQETNRDRREFGIPHDDHAHAVRHRDQGVLGK